MKRDAWYKFSFEDGFSVICMNMNPVNAAVYIAKHGKITNKEFVAWEKDLVLSDIVGGVEHEDDH